MTARARPSNNAKHQSRARPCWNVMLLLSSQQWQSNTDRLNANEFQWSSANCRVAILMRAKDKKRWEHLLCCHVQHKQVLLLSCFTTWLLARWSHKAPKVAVLKGSKLFGGTLPGASGASEGVSSNEFNQLLQWAFEIVMKCLIHIPAVVNDSRKHARKWKKRKVLSSANTAYAFIHFLPWLPQISYLSLSHSQCQFKCRVYCSKHWICVVTKLWINFSSETSHFSWSDSRSRAKPDTFERL